MMVMPSEQLFKHYYPLYQRLANTLAAKGSHTVCVGLSGGVDSVVLLHALHQASQLYHFDLSAIHIHHGLQAEADAWARLCVDLCRHWSIPLKVEKVNVKPNNQGLEAAARVQRYNAFSQQMAEIIALAHHEDDQLETFLLAALRGGGLRGLAAMPEWRVNTLAHHGQQQIWRPLLGLSKQSIHDYAAAWALDYVHDPSNDDIRLQRNAVRHLVLPQILAATPNATGQITATITKLQHQLAAFEEWLDNDIAQVSDGLVLHLPLWRTWGQARQREVLVAFAERADLGHPTPQSVNQFLDTLADKPKTAQWQLPKGSIYLYRERLFAVSNHWLAEKIGWRAVFEQGMAQYAIQQNMLMAKTTHWGLPPLQSDWRIRPAHKNDCIRTHGGRKAVMRLLQEQGVPKIMRQYWPVITDAQNRCLAVAQIWVDNDIAIADGWLPVSSLLAMWLQPSANSEK